MNSLQNALSMQIKKVEKLKKCKIFAFHGYGIPHIIVFDKLLYSLDELPGPENTQEKIDSGYYKSIEDFDSYYTADIGFEDLYSGDNIEIYREETLRNMKELAMAWRKRVSSEFPHSAIWIVIHKEDHEWFLDTFNHPVAINGGLYL